MKLRLTVISLAGTLLLVNCYSAGILSRSPYHAPAAVEPAGKAAASQTGYDFLFFNNRPSLHHTAQKAARSKKADALYEAGWEEYQWDLFVVQFYYLRVKGEAVRFKKEPVK